MNQSMNASRYDELIAKIGTCINAYEGMYGQNRYCMGLANGDFINIVLPRNNIPHLLGVETDTIKRAGLANVKDSSYSILKKLTDSNLTYMSMMNRNVNFDISTIFSDFTDNKIEIFNDILKIRTDDVYAVIKYVSDRSYTTGDEKENSDYFIIRKHYKKYSVLGLVKSDDENKTYYVPVTSRLYNNYEELSEFLSKVAKNQEVTYPTSLIISNYDKKYDNRYYSKLEDKLVYNNNLKDIATKYNAIPSTNRDFLAIIDKSLNNRQKSNNNASILNVVKEGIASGNIIDKEEVKERLDDEEIPSDLESLIDACNDLICKNSQSDETVTTSYSSIQNENTRLKNELESLKRELLEVKNYNASLEIEKNNLASENEVNVKKLKTLVSAFESIK